MGKKRKAIKQEPKQAQAVKWQKIVIICCLVAITLAVFGRAVTFDFVNYDDPGYVHHNQNVLSGMSLDNIRWAITTVHEANWHPLTWISLMLDAEIGGGKPWMFHLTSVVLHAANVILLFLLLNVMTGSVWRSAFVAALFAVHPLHVESVAWVAERKDVLSTLFWLLTMLAYVYYVKRPTRARYVMVTVTFALGLMAKPMLVSLPIVLLLIDFWPLARWKKNVWLLVREKIPLLAVALSSCVMTFWAQRVGGAVASVEGFPFVARLANADVSYGAYALKMVWPLELSVFYPPRLAIPAWEITLSASFFVAATLLAVRSAKHASMRWITVGWFWYVITLVPVIGFVQVGQQAMADRYTYVPLIGLFIIISWGVPMVAERLINKQVARSAMLGVIAAAAIVVLAAQGYIQVGYWKNTIVLFQHSIRVTENNAVAEKCLALEFVDKEHYGEAIQHFKNALAINPNYAPAHQGLGSILCKTERFQEAERELNEALRIDPKLENAYNDLGIVLARQGKSVSAMKQFDEAIRLDPDFAEAYCNLGNVLIDMGEYKRAIGFLRQAIRIKPDYGIAYGNLAVAYYNMHDYSAAWKNVQMCRKHGFEPPTSFIESLARSMPEPIK